MRHVRQPGSLIVRPATRSDAPAIWAILEPIVLAGEAFALPRDMNATDAVAYWTGAGHDCFVACDGDAIVGTSYIRANQQGGGAHVANAGFAVRVQAAGRGVARAMAEHALAHARALGFRAMQFNFVVSSNDAAIYLWRSLGFAEVGRLPRAFDHPTLGEIDALVMHRML